MTVLESGKNERVKFGPFEGMTEETPCLLCKGSGLSRLVFKTKESIGFYKCSACNLIYASPRFTEESMLKIYENEAFADLSVYNNWSYNKWIHSKSRSYNVEQQKILLLKKYLPEGSKILDVGCGAGLFVLEANEKGFLCEGIEPSSMLSDIGRTILKVPISSLQIEDFNPSHKFKGIIIWDVLEHLYDPVRVMKRCAELLETGGFLFAQVPNHKGIADQYKTGLCRLGLKKEFKHFGFPWHVYSFDRKSLSLLMDKAGLKPIHFESWSHLLKNGKMGLMPKIIINLTKKFCLSDYIVCVVEKAALSDVPDVE